MTNNLPPLPPLLPQTVDCPHCGLPTYRLKLFPVEDVECFVYLVIRRTRNLVGCPTCMRWALLRHLFGSVLTANLLWPLVLLWDAILWLSTYTRGHSRRVALLVSGQELKPSEDDVIDPLAGATLGAAGGILGGALLGMLGGRLAYKNLGAIMDSVPAVVLGDLGAVAGGLLCVLLFALAAGDVIRTILWSLGGAVIWLGVRWLAEEHLGWRVGGTVFAWAIGGASVGVFGSARALAFFGGRGCGFTVGESPAAQGGWGPGLSGAVGGVVGGELAGILFGGCSGFMLAGILGSSVLGGLGGLSGGLALGRGTQSMALNAGADQLPPLGTKPKEGSSTAVTDSPPDHGRKPSQA